MNETQLFLIFASILAFGWIGFAAGMVADEEQSFSVTMFILGSVALFIGTFANLFVLVSKNL